ncbi:hypothetical protein HNO92_003334 [Chromobacterium alkanivorans]|nr:hypothetical protein [Chromobacterium alkanivorans]MCS3805906.1 hypothetical protein [Chromobacterium alkanivorans]MCS3875002.1 hypothetical protein [Chromobacterium alkanivorans]
MLALLAWPLVMAALLLMSAWSLFWRGRLGFAARWGFGGSVAAFAAWVLCSSAEFIWRESLYSFGFFLLMAGLFWMAAVVHAWKGRA